MGDATTTVGYLKAQVERFAEERDWEQFHGAKDLAIGVVTEAAELLEVFRFRSEGAVDDLLADPVQRERIEHELADVLFFMLRLAGRYGIDLTDAFARKLALNAERYPVEKARGSNRKYDEL